MDQVEQVDAGLTLDRATIKFQWMFDMKTPNRTYYLAADSEVEMRNWVMVICQVCNLQETEEKNGVNDSSSTQCKFPSYFILIFISSHNSNENVFFFHKYF